MVKGWGTMICAHFAMCLGLDAHLYLRLHIVCSSWHVYIMACSFWCLYSVWGNYVWNYVRGNRVVIGKRWYDIEETSMWFGKRWYDFWRKPPVWFGMDWHDLGCARWKTWETSTGMTATPVIVTCNNITHDDTGLLRIELVLVTGGPYQVKM